MHWPQPSSRAVAAVKFNRERSLCLLPAIRFLFNTQNVIFSQGIVATDTTCTRLGRIAQPDVALLADRDRLHPSVRLYLEPGVIRIEYSARTGSEVTGTEDDPALLTSLVVQHRRELVDF